MAHPPFRKRSWELKFPVSILPPILLKQEMPDTLITYGDTNSTLASAIAASKIGIRIAHVEAGLRSFNMAMPEEINRILTDRISNLLLCPTETALVNLKKEGVENNHFQTAVKVGDVMFDAARYYSEFSATKSTIRADITFPYSLVTIHRAENTDNIDRLTRIFGALNEISSSENLVFPIHPRTRNILASSDIKLSGNITLIDPVGYFDTIELIKGSNVVLTDSGGLQKEAYFFNKPCVTLRDQTEWVELVAAGVNQLASGSMEEIVSAFNNMKLVSVDNLKLQLYGDGNASSKIVKIING